MDIFLLNDIQIIERLSQSCKDKRIALGLTQKDLAERSNLALKTISKFEAGEAPSFKTVLSILRALGEVHRVSSLFIENLESPKELFYKNKNK